MLKLRQPRANALVLLRPDCVSAIEPSNETWGWPKPGGHPQEWDETYSGPSCAVWLTNAAKPIYIRGTVEELGSIIEKAILEGE